MARTTSTAVCAIIDTSLGDESIAAFIRTANQMVTAHLGSVGLDGTLLTEIETYLTAHFITLRERRVMSESADGVSFTYEGQSGVGLDATGYGQTAQVLDTSGTLAQLSDEDRIAWLSQVGSA
jgi:hypothetical protein